MIKRKRISALFTLSIRPVRVTLLWVLIAPLLAVFWAGCSSSPPPEKPEPDIFSGEQFTGWKVYTYENVEILYQPGHPQEGSFPQVAKGYLKALDQVSAALDIPVPQDTIKIIYYTGWGQGREMTGRDYPYAEDGVIHFWLPSFFGPTFVRWILPYWVPEGPKYEFLKHGLISLFDYSGQDYDAMTLQYVADGRFISLDSLAVDTTINSNIERLQSGEAASFVAFILENYGESELKKMYLSQVAFDWYVKNNFGMPVDSLQAHWLNYARSIVPDSTKQRLEKR